MNPVYDQFRLGLEMNLGALSFGSLNTFDNNVTPSVMTEGNVLIRINTKGDAKRKLILLLMLHVIQLHINGLHLIPTHQKEFIIL